MPGRRVTRALLTAATLVVATSVILDRFPEMTSDLLARLTDGAGQDPGAGHDMSGMEMKEAR